MKRNPTIREQETFWRLSNKPNARKAFLRKRRGMEFRVFRPSDVKSAFRSSKSNLNISLEFEAIAPHKNTARLLRECEIKMKKLKILWRKIREAEEVSQGERAGYVYFVQSDAGTWKIGMSDNPIRRMRELQVASSARLSLFHTIKTDDCAKLESALHKVFKSSPPHQHIHGEWFKLDSSDSVFLHWTSTRELNFLVEGWQDLYEKNKYEADQLRGQIKIIFDSYERESERMEREREHIIRQRGNELLSVMARDLSAALNF